MGIVKEKKGVRRVHFTTRVIKGDRILKDFLRNLVTCFGIAIEV